MVIMDDIEKIINTLIVECEHFNSELHLNERYLHHRFSFLVQEKYPISLTNSFGLHPEWATNIKYIRPGGCYKEDKELGKYFIDESGGAGFIDFAIGEDNKPSCAIEFKMSSGFEREGLTYDYVKLLDPENSIGMSYSLVVYYNRKSESKKLSDYLNKCIKDAYDRLKGRNKTLNKHHFYVLEIFEKKTTRVANLYECLNDNSFRRPQEKLDI